MPETLGGPHQTSDGPGAQAQEKAKQVAGQAQEKAADARREARSRMRDQVDQRSTEASERVRGAAEDVRSVAIELRRQGKDTPARYAEQAAERVQSAGDWLRDSDGDRILRDVEDFARRNPWAVVAGGLALGFVASRMLKASSGERYHSSLSTSSTSRGTIPGRAASTRSLAGEPMPTGRATVPPQFTREAPVSTPDPMSPRP